ncbi:MAG: PEP-CTERM sorting domain-containing protein [Burkholderiaceae bacterium]
MNFSFLKSKLVFVLALLLPVLASAVPLFNNGSVDPSRTTWNDTASSWMNYDEFVLSSNSTITDLTYSVFMQSASFYSKTDIAIYNSAGTSVVVPLFATAGTLTSNGLTTTNPNVPNGFDVAISGLSLNLGAGTYYIGFGTEMLGSQLASIGSGSGSIQSVGTGLHQALMTQTPAGAGIHTGDHMSFQINGTSSVPEPTTLALLGLGLFGFSVARRRKQ